MQVVGSDEQDAVDVDVARWCRLAEAVLVAEGASGELTMTFVDLDEITALNEEHLGGDGPTDVLSFPLDAELPEPAALDPDGFVDDAGAGVDAAPPTLLGDVVICPEYAERSAPTHAGTLDDEIALLVVHGVLHVLGHDHAEPDETARMRTAELTHLERSHWDGPAPPGFRQDHAGA